VCDHALRDEQIIAAKQHFTHYITFIAVAGGIDFAIATQRAYTYLNM